MRKVIIVFIAFLFFSCLTAPMTSSANITVTYQVRNTSFDIEWVVIQHKDVLGDIETELYMKPGEVWEKKVNFRLPEYGSQHLTLAAHSLYGTFETTITIDDINQSIHSRSRPKPNIREYLSLSQLHIDRETIKRYR